MATWTIDHPEKLTFDTVRRLRVARTVSGEITLAGCSGHVALLRREPEARESQ